MKTAAKIISFIFHPLLLATYLTLTLGVFFPAMINSSKIIALSLFIFGFTFLLPVLNILIYRWLTVRAQRLESKREVSDSFLGGILNLLLLESWRERKLPFVFISIMYTIIAYLFVEKFPHNGNLNKLLIITAALVVTATVLTFFVKVSVHSLAMGGWVGILLPLIHFSPSLLWPTATIIFLTGIVISSRLALQSHTTRETTIGALAGLLISYGGMIVLF